MPLTQARMLTLIEAANAYREALENVGLMLVDLAKDPSITPMTIASHQDKLLALDKRHYRALALEDAHFAAHGKRNIREAARQRAKRDLNRESANYRSATIAHNKRHGPTLADHERDVAEFLALEEALRNTTGTNAPKSAANESQSEANPLETLDKTNTEQPGNKR